MKKPMLNAIQKVKMSMAMKSKNPKMNPGFDSLPKEVQNKIMKKKAKLSMKKKPKMAMKKPKVGMKKVPKGDMTMPKMAMKKPAMMGDKKPKLAKDKSKSKLLKKGSKESKKILQAGFGPGKKPKMAMKKKPKMAMKKKPKMAMKKAKASQTAGAIMKRERMMN